MSKKITFADRAKQIKNKYYKSRKPGEDDLTDEAFNREMKKLQMLQESVKPKEQPQNQPRMDGNGQGMEQGQQIMQEQPQMANGGNLPKYAIGDYLNPTPEFNSFNYNPSSMNGLNYDSSNFGQNAFYNPNEFSSQGFNADITPDVNLNNPQSQSIGSGESSSDFSPMANVLGPAVSIAGNAVQSHILKNAASDQRDRLLKLTGVNLGRVNAQQIDLGRERTNIKANQALSEASGRYVSRGARSASERANIINQARLGSQRISGSLLGQSLQKEETTNASLRNQANNQNRELAAQENTMRARQVMDIEKQFGGVDQQLNANLAGSTTQSISNYIAENQKMKQYYDMLKLRQPNMNIQFDGQDDKKWLYDLGILNPEMSVNARS